VKQGSKEALVKCEGSKLNICIGSLVPTSFVILDTQVWPGEVRGSVCEGIKLKMISRLGAAFQSPINLYTYVHETG